MVHLMLGEIIMTEDTIRGLQSQIDSLGRRMEKSFDEIKTIVTGFDTRVRTVELKEANRNPILTAKMEAAWRKLDEHDLMMKEFKKTVEELKNSINELMHTNKILKWILGILTVLITAYFGKLILG